MKLHVLGSGSCLINQERTSSGYLVQIHDQKIMVDTGTGTTENLRKLGLDSSDLDAVVNTHRHPDHVSDLVPIIQDKVVKSFQSKQSKITLIGPENHKNYLKRRMHDEMRTKPAKVTEEFGFELEVVELDTRYVLDEIEIDSIYTKHGPDDFPCLAVKLSSEKEIVFTGDTDYFSDLAEFAKEADILIADCSKPDEEKAEGHMTPTECAKIAKKANVDMLILSHLYPDAEEANIKETASETFRGDIIVAEDLMSIEI